MVPILLVYLFDDKLQRCASSLGRLTLQAHPLDPIDLRDCGSTGLYYCPSSKETHGNWVCFYFWISMHTGIACLHWVDSKCVADIFSPIDLTVLDGQNYKYTLQHVLAFDWHVFIKLWNRDDSWKGWPCWWAMTILSWFVSNHKHMVAYTWSNLSSMIYKVVLRNCKFAFLNINL